MPSNAVMPYLTYDDPNAAIDWLKNAFGAQVIDVSTDESGAVGHAELGVGDGLILLTAADGGGRLPLRSPRRSGHSSQGVFVRIQRSEVDEHYQRAVAAGAQVLYPLEDKPYGSREYTCQDLEGHLWSFGSYSPGQG